MIITSKLIILDEKTIFYPFDLPQNQYHYLLIVEFIRQYFFSNVVLYEHTVDSLTK